VKNGACHDTTASSFVTEVRGYVFANFHTVSVKRDSSMRNGLFGLPGQIFLLTIPSMLKKMLSVLLTLLFICPAFLALP
jgi:hypothetical protein